MRLLRTREEDRMVDVAEWLNSAVGDRRQAGDAILDGGYGASSSPRTSS